MESCRPVLEKSTRVVELTESAANVSPLAFFGQLAISSFKTLNVGFFQIVQAHSAFFSML